MQGAASPSSKGSLLVGVDDTDSPQGGCTTALAASLPALFPDLEPDGPPRLVRLNPNIPWKTRGNAAIALRFHGHADLDDALAAVVKLVEGAAERHERTEPGVVVAHAPPPASFYEAAVTRVVTRDEADAAIRAAGARAWGGRGVIGAAAALAWDPVPREREDQDAAVGRVETAALAWPAARATWERIAYRAPERIGTPRDVDDAWVREVEWGFATTFDSYDLANDEVVCVPSGPDPVLWGIRGDDPEDLMRASAILGPERPASETLFLTNQGTDDHLVDRRIVDCQEHESVRVRGRIAKEPKDQNGTILAELDDGSGALRCAAYPPTRAFRRLLRALHVGDDVTACGGLHAAKDGRLTLGLEKLHVHATVPRPAGAPACPKCKQSMQSAGKGAGYRCKGCHTRAEGPRKADSVVRPGWHEVPASARRHLAMPLKRALR